MVSAPSPPPVSAPVLIFDGDCRFCRKWVARLQSWAPVEIPAAPAQEVASAFPDIPEEDFQNALQYIDRQGRRHSAARAVFQCMAEHGLSRLPLRAWEKVPGVAAVTECVYRWVARNRVALSRIEFALSGPSLTPPTYQYASTLFVRGLGLIYALAFFSLAPQIDGLAGPGGIQPAGAYLEAVAQHFGGPVPAKAPTLFWWGGGGALEAACWIGGVLGLIALAGIAPLPALGAALLLYLSIVQVGGPFLAFQWDNLLLECGVIALFLAGWKGTRTHLAGRILVSWLLFRLMFCSGVVKLASGDLSWRGLTALDYHFETQPLPTVPAWWMHQLPDLVLTGATLAMFFCQLVLPFAIFGPRRLKLLAAGAFILLEGGIALTGNYGYFNLLSILLALTLVDDATWNRLGLRARGPARPAPRTATLAAAVWLGIVALVSIPQVVRSFRIPFHPPGIHQISAALAPFRIINSYGLFAVMTRDRREIVLEGSTDGREWKAYPLAWNPGDPSRPPAWVAPHQPRLDWQMWFAALGRARDNPWFLQTVRQLLLGSDPVEGLFRENPFPDAPPRYVRALVRTYRFTGHRTRAETGQWWDIGPPTLYLGPVGLDDFGNR